MCGKLVVQQAQELHANCISFVELKYKFTVMFCCLSHGTAKGPQVIMVYPPKPITMDKKPGAKADVSSDISIRSGGSSSSDLIDLTGDDGEEEDNVVSGQFLCVPLAGRYMYQGQKSSDGRIGVLLLNPHQKKREKGWGDFVDII